MRECFLPLLAGILSLLKESEDEIKIFALKKLDQLVDVFWAEIAESISAMYVLSVKPLSNTTLLSMHHLAQCFFSEKMSK